MSEISQIYVYIDTDVRNKNYIFEANVMNSMLKVLKFSKSKNTGQFKYKFTAHENIYGELKKINYCK